MKKYVFLALIALTACAKKGEEKQSAENDDSAPVVAMEMPADSDLTVAFYNVENLFDTKDNPNKNDEDFLPEGSYQWTEERYYKKLDQLAKVISQLDEGSAPEIIGLCEVENREVLEDLVRTEGLKMVSYKIAHDDSPDKRGIDLALLYQDRFFRPFQQQDFAIDYEGMVTRDILMVSGTTAKNDTIHFLVNHFPSRRGGREASEPKRVFVAQKLRNIVDSLSQQNPNSKIIIMGDFNDTPGDKSIRETLRAQADRSALNAGDMFNAMAKMAEEGKGTYNFRGNWDMLDQMILSQPLLNDREGFYYQEGSSMIFEPDWLKQQEGKYKGYPDRTYGGRKYLGGYSDHFPVKIELIYEK